MAVRAVVLDLDGTLLASDGTLVSGVEPMLADLASANVLIAIASNRPRLKARCDRVGLQPDLYLTRASLGISKGSPVWVEHACREFGVERNELVWLGDSDLDMRSAVQGKVAYFHARWSDPGYQYGLPVSAPRLFGVIIRECFQKPRNWYWRLSTHDQLTRPVESRALMDSNGAGINAFRGDLIKTLKDKVVTRVGPFNLADFMMFHLIGSIYSEGLYREVDIWTVYPGSRPASGPNVAMVPFTNRAAKMFREGYWGDLLIRHRQAEDSSESRTKGIPVTFLNQTDTMQLNPKYRSQVSGKHVLEAISEVG